MMKFPSGILASLAATGLMALVGSGAANAGPVEVSEDTMTVVIKSPAVDDTFTANYLCEAGTRCKGRGDDDLPGGADPDQEPTMDLSAMIIWTVSAVGATTIEFDLEIWNTTKDISVTGDASINSFGIITLVPTPDGVGVDNTGSIVWFAGIGVGSSGGFGTLDLCVSSNTPVSCTGGGSSTGLDADTHDTLTLTFTFDAGVPEMFSLAFPTIKFQGASINEGDDKDSFEFLGMFAGGTDIPEPGTMGILGMGLLGFGLARRRRRIAA